MRRERHESCMLLCVQSQIPTTWTMDHLVQPAIRPRARAGDPPWRAACRRRMARRTRSPLQISGSASSASSVVGRWALRSSTPLASVPCQTCHAHILPLLAFCLFNSRPGHSSSPRTRSCPLCTTMTETETELMSVPSVPSVPRLLGNRPSSCSTLLCVCFARFVVTHSPPQLSPHAHYLLVYA